ncbi:peptide chain release factor N(5)-glutamine methyltransferase [Faecalimonas sp.]
MTLEEAYRKGKQVLEKNKIRNASVDAWILLEYVTKVDRAIYYANPKKELKEEEETQYKDFIEQRIKRIPLQHLTKEQEFMGLSFEVNENVLIPRQDTEILVESVLENLNGTENILDVCTGSGCILISLLKHSKGTKGIGVDISEKALEVAKRNAKIHEVDATFIQSDLFECVEGVYDVIVSNPPYIKTKEIEKLEEEVKLHDPLLALDGKEDGLYFYRKIIKDSKKYLTKNGRLYFEIGNTQGEEVKRLMEEAGFVNVKIKKDLAGLDRVVYGV